MTTSDTDVHIILHPSAVAAREDGFTLEPERETQSHKKGNKDHASKDKNFRTNE